MRDLVLCLPEAASDNRDTWRNIGFALKHTGGGSDQYFKDFRAFSMRSAKWDGDHKCRRFWDGLKHSGGRVCTFGTLCHVAKEGNPEACMRAFEAADKRNMHIVCPPGVFIEEGEGQGGLIPIKTRPRNRGRLTATTSNARVAATSGSKEVLSMMLEDFPEHFAHLRPESFKAELLGNAQLKLSESPAAFKATMTYPQCSILVDGAEDPVCALAGNFQIKNLQEFHERIQNDTTFAFIRTVRETDVTEMRGSDAVSGAVSLTVFNAFSKKNINPQLTIAGKTTKVTKKQIEHLYNQIAVQAAKHVVAALGPSASALFNIFNFNTQINITSGDSSEPDNPKTFELIRNVLLAAGVRDRLRKGGGNVYQPVEGCPCAYIKHSDYKLFINTQLQNDTLYHSDPGNFKKLMEYLTNFVMVQQIPEYHPDRDLLSFSNGVLQLAAGVFTEYEGIDAAAEGLSQRVARHHIPYPYTGLIATPLLDTILDAQFEPDVAELLFALLGRCLFTVGQRDGWQIMLFLVGVGGTGKSLLLKVVTALFAEGTVGMLAAKREEVFGMANLFEKELVIGADMPAKMSASLSQENMQCMTSGERMEVALKGKTAEMIRWTAPLIMAGNHMPDYVNTGNNIGRRIVSIRFDNPVANPQTDLEKRILASELPNIVCRALAAYTSYIDRVAAGGGGLWKHVPQIVRDWQGWLSASTNKLAEFFAMDDKLRKFSIRRVEGATAWLEDVQAAYAASMSLPLKPAVLVIDEAVLLAHGFRLEKGVPGRTLETSLKREMMCKSCKGYALANCCLDGTGVRNNRIKKALVHNMEFLPYEGDAADA